MAQTQRISRNNTAVMHDSEGTHVILHSTRIVSFNDKRITLNNGGWITATTATRMNQVSNEYRLGYAVGRCKGVMSVRYNGVEQNFNGDTITLERN